MSPVAASGDWQTREMMSHITVAGVCREERTSVTCYSFLGVGENMGCDGCHELSGRKAFV